MIRRFLPGIVTFGLVIAVVLAASVLAGGKALGAVTTISLISPDVTVRHGAGAAFVTAIDGETLESGDAIRTGEAGRAVLTFFEGSTVTIEPGTELVIDVAAAHGGDTVVRMTQEFGRTWHVVTKLITGGSRYDVRTPSSTASVRGTEFEVVSDTTSTTVTTTEGTVMDEVPDPAQAGRVVDVPVRAGTTHTQQKGAAPSAPREAPQPTRTVTVTVSASNSLIVDPQGRANGIRKDGKLIVQTPGARVKRDGDTIVITLPDIADGRLTTHVEKDSDEPVVVRTTVSDRDGSVEVDDEAKDTSIVELKSGDGGPEARIVATPRPTATRSPSPTVRTRTPSATPSSDRDRRTETPRPRG